MKKESDQKAVKQKVAKKQKGLVSFNTNPFLVKLVRLAGIEPTTPWFVGMVASRKSI